MKLKNILVMIAVATTFAANTGKAEDTITVPPGRTVVEPGPGQSSVEVAPSETIIVPVEPVEPVAPAPSTTVIMTEPAGTVHTDEDKDKLFSDQEFSIDLFGSWREPDNDFNDIVDDLDIGDENDGDWGGGVGMNYFFARMFGVGVDAFGEDNGGPFVDAISGSLILRVPIDAAHLAPYAFGGGGYQFEGNDTFTWHAGGGLEFRFTHHVGIFADGRYVWADESNVSDYALFRGGLRFSF